jgi:hypothetical protein
MPKNQVDFTRDKMFNRVFCSAKIIKVLLCVTFQIAVLTDKNNIMDIVIVTIK